LINGTTGVVGAFEGSVVGKTVAVGLGLSGGALIFFREYHPLRDEKQR